MVKLQTNKENKFYLISVLKGLIKEINKKALLESEMCTSFNYDMYNQFKVNTIQLTIKLGEK